MKGDAERVAGSGAGPGNSSRFGEHLNALGMRFANRPTHSWAARLISCQPSAIDFYGSQFISY